MSKFMMWFKKVMLVAMVAGIGLSAFRITDAFALGLNDTATPPAPTRQASNDRLEKAWAVQQARYQHMGKLFDLSDKRIAGAQKLINRAKANGKDVNALQTALDALSAAVKQAKTIFDGGQSLISSHSGFDAAGKVTDATQAKATIKSMHDIFQQVRQIVEGPRKALIQAIKDFRQANGK